MRGVGGRLLIFIGPVWCVSSCRDSVCSSAVLFNNAVNTVDHVHEGDALHYTSTYQMQVICKYRLIVSDVFPAFPPVCL